MAKNCIILHGCPSDKEKAMNPETRTYDKHWIPWAKKEIEKLGISVETPHMPEPWAASYSEWKNEFSKFLVGEDTILIGHSCGCAFLVRWLAETKRKIKSLILVAPWKTPDDDFTGSRREFYLFDIDQGVADQCGNITIFTSNDEEEQGKKDQALYHQVLGGKLIVLENHGHYTLGDMGTEEFPELIETVKKS